MSKSGTGRQFSISLKFIHQIFEILYLAQFLQTLLLCWGRERQKTTPHLWNRFAAPILLTLFNSFISLAQPRTTPCYFWILHQNYIIWYSVSTDVFCAPRINAPVVHRWPPKPWFSTVNNLQKGGNNTERLYGWCEWLKCPKFKNRNSKIIEIENCLPVPNRSYLLTC